MGAINTGKLQRSPVNCHESRLPLIEAVNLGVKYEGEKKKGDDFRSVVYDFFRGEWRKKVEPFWALKKISFSGYPGDVLGVIGSNGAGKTTLCRVLSGLLRPDTGSLKVRGEVSSLLSLGTGFNKELSGRDNVFLNGLMLGFSKKQVQQLLPSIRDFSGLGEFFDEPVKHYSNGMQARLGFSIASSLEAEIMVIDEVLGTGDLEFQERAVQRMWQLVSGAKMVVVVTHSTEFVEKNCNRALWIEEGELRALGKPGEIVSLYKDYAASKARPKKKRIINLWDTRTEVGSKKAIEVENLGIRFKLAGKPFWALNDISFKVHEKEIVGIIGPNGAGKSTLCRLLCGIYRADKGTTRVYGDVTALLSFGAGFNAQLSGRDNIYLNGMMLGIPRKVLRDLEQEIVEFAELENAIHKPVKNFSSGMRSRLGFSIAAMLRPDIFIVDEALSAGDISFQEKATVKMQEMLEEAKAVVIVTHSLAIVEKICTRALWLKKGQLLFDGDPGEAVQRYQDSVKKKA